DGWDRASANRRGYYVAAANWTGEDGTVWPVKITGTAIKSVNEAETTMPLPDENGFVIRRYYREQPPAITVDGYRMDDPFPTEGDFVDPDKILGTADVMIESTVRTDLGVEINRKVLAWSQANHDDYLIYDWSDSRYALVSSDPAKAPVLKCIISKMF
ncbi:unnamed protein product, partial [marine sediment metagenome]